MGRTLRAGEIPGEQRQEQVGSRHLWRGKRRTFHFNPVGTEWKCQRTQHRIRVSKEPIEQQQKKSEYADETFIHLEKTPPN